MKIKSILFLSFIIFSSSLFSQENIKLNLSVSTNEASSDSLNEKIRIISEDLGVINSFTGTLIEGVSFDYPKNQSEEKSGIKIESIVTKSLGKFYETHSETFSDLVTDYLNNFSLQELKTLAEFYETDLGSKVLSINTKSLKNLTQAKADFLVAKDEVYIELFGKKALKKMK